MGFRPRVQKHGLFRCGPRGAFALVFRNTGCVDAGGSSMFSINACMKIVGEGRARVCCLLEWVGSCRTRWTRKQGSRAAVQHRPQQSGSRAGSQSISQAGKS